MEAGAQGLDMEAYSKYIVLRDLQAAILPIDGDRGPGSGHGGLHV